MARKSARPASTPAHHALGTCDCATCRKKALPTAGGRASSVLPAVADDPTSRFTRLHDAGREAGAGRKLGFVTLSDRFVRYLDRATDTAWTAWTALSEEERTCYALCIAQGLPQREVARQLGTSQATVHRRLQSATAALAACR